MSTTTKKGPPPLFRPSNPVYTLCFSLKQKRKKKGGFLKAIPQKETFDCGDTSFLLFT